MRRSSSLTSLCLAITSVAILAGCATPAPVAFNLIDDGPTQHQGTFIRDSQKVTARIGERVFEGNYLVGSSTAFYNQAVPVWSRWYTGPWDRTTTVISNSARAHLTSADGESLSCEFLFEPPRAIGTCKSNKGKTYQLVARG